MIGSIDHVVLTTGNLERCLDFYTRVLGMQLERYGPTSDVVSAAWAQLPDADRKQLRKQLRDRWVALEGERNKLREAGQAVYDAAKAEPFDEGKLRDAVTIFQQREYRMQQSAEDILIDHLGKMPPEARATPRASARPARP